MIKIGLDDLDADAHPHHMMTESIDVGIRRVAGTQEARDAGALSRVAFGPNHKLRRVDATFANPMGDRLLYDSGPPISGGETSLTVSANSPGHGPSPDTGQYVLGVDSRLAIAADGGILLVK